MTQLISRGLRKAPVKKTRSHVHEDGHREDEGGPVVDLPDEQAATDVEGDVDGGPVGVGHDDALQRHVGAVVDDGRRAAGRTRR